MKSLFLRSIALTGRYFALVPIGIAFLIGFLWINLIDTSLIWFLVLGVFAAPAFLAGIALAIGMLFSGTKPNLSHGVTRDEAPNLWKMAEEEFGEKHGSNLKIYISADLNASVLQTRKLFGFLGNNIELEIGIPLLRVMDMEAVRAVMQHEFAHLKNRDTNGGRNTAEFFLCFEFLFEFMPPGETITGTVIYYLLSDVSTLVENEQMRLSRIAEIRADQTAAKAGSALEVARSTYLLTTATEFFETEIFIPLQKEILGSAFLPTSAYSRLLSRADELQDQRKLGNLWQASLVAKPKVNSSHPTTAETFKALEVNLDTRFTIVEKSALPMLITPELQQKIDNELQEAWEVEMEHVYQH